LDKHEHQPDDIYKLKISTRKRKKYHAKKQENLQDGATLPPLDIRAQEEVLDEDLTYPVPPKTESDKNLQKQKCEQTTTPPQNPKTPKPQNPKDKIKINE
jgi:hypothetical protein